MSEIVTKKNLGASSASNTYIYNHHIFYEKQQVPVRFDGVLFSAGAYHMKVKVQAIQNQRSSVRLFSNNVKALAGINGGYYREDFLPNGLLIAHGRLISKMVYNRLLSAVLSVNIQGKLSLMSRNNFELDYPPLSYSNIQFAFQAGPILVSNNQIMSVPNDLLKKRRRRRSIIILFRNYDVAIVSLSAIRLFEAEKLLMKADHQFWADEPILMALNLDGGSAASFLVRQSQKIIFYPEQKYVKYLVLFFVGKENFR